jgi:hypothetical protein
VDVDPLSKGGDFRENQAQVVNATDGDVNTAWKTEQYATEDFGRLKQGVGLKVTLGTASTVTGVRIASPTAGGAVQVLAVAPAAEGVPSVPLGSGELQANGVIRVTAPQPLSEFYIWLTQLPRSGSGDFPYQAAIGEVEVLGVAKT